MSDIREIQLEVLDIFLQFKRICEEHGLRYYLTGGTLLGAVRHCGFIPWDDDMDIAMPREDYNRFMQIQKETLPEGYRFICPELDKKAADYFGKMKKVSADLTEEDPCFVDIFPLDLCPDRDLTARVYFKLMGGFNYALRTRLANYLIPPKRFYKRVVWEVLRRFPDALLFRLRWWLRGVFEHFCSGARVCNLAGRYGFPGEVHGAAWFVQPMTKKFEGVDCSVPNGWDELLTNMYGDYMTLPDESERHGHFDGF